MYKDGYHTLLMGFIKTHNNFIQLMLLLCLGRQLNRMFQYCQYLINTHSNQFSHMPLVRRQSYHTKGLTQKDFVGQWFIQKVLVTNQILHHSVQIYQFKLCMQYHLINLLYSSLFSRMFLIHHLLYHTKAVIQLELKELWLKYEQLSLLLKQHLKMFDIKHYLLTELCQRLAVVLQLRQQHRFLLQINLILCFVYLIGLELLSCFVLGLLMQHLTGRQL